ncbi:aldose epimerase family protein [uncultured Oscillibacter sp.]|uniref:aldose epimerase family protein n=1 Tax=uncultured Oscillibacter sp. TaxID=876091 RepID=UPI0025EEA2E8|nr:aldose epimerase family protein [uncultured Oscillibacter sp.]
MERKPFGVTRDGRAVEEIVLDNGKLRCSLLTYGASLRGLIVPGAAGPVDVALGFESMEAYETQDKFMGAVVGRYANRIAGGRFTLDGQDYTLARNDGENHLHGGPEGFFSKVWNAELCGENGVAFSCESRDMEEGYPGFLKVSVTYRLEDNALRLSYRAVTDRTTICNLTNHAYFNLNGHDAGGAMEQLLTLYASRYTPVGPGSIPTGEIALVEGTPMDFRAPAVIGARIGQPFRQLELCSGYDHNWIVDGKAGILRPAAMLEGAKSGIRMEVETTLPGIQFYAGNYMAGCPAGKGGAKYGLRDAVCLETQFFPDTPNHPEFPQCVLRPGEAWEHVTVFRFSSVG